MQIKIVCMTCGNRFQRTAQQIVGGDACARCASTDLDLDVSEYGIFGGDGAGAWPGAYEDGYYDGYLWGMRDGEAQRMAPDAPEDYRRGYRDGYDDADAGRQPRTLIEEIKAASSKTAGHRDPGFCEVCGQAILPGPNPGSFVHYDTALELAHQATPNEATKAWYAENAPQYLASRRMASMPEAVVVDQRDGQVIAFTAQGEPHTLASAKEMADAKNSNLKEPGAYVVRRLVEGAHRTADITSDGFWQPGDPTPDPDSNYTEEEFSEFGLGPNHPDSPYNLDPEHTTKAIDWLMELRRLQGEEGKSFDEALAIVNARPEHQAKRNEIAKTILAHNPKMSHRTALRVAEETIRRFPKVVG